MSGDRIQSSQTTAFLYCGKISDSETHMIICFIGCMPYESNLSSLIPVVRLLNL